MYLFSDEAYIDSPINIVLAEKVLAAFFVKSNVLELTVSVVDREDFVDLRFGSDHISSARIFFEGPRIINSAL